MQNERGGDETPLEEQNVFDYRVRYGQDRFLSPTLVGVLVIVYGLVSLYIWGIIPQLQVSRTVSRTPW